MLINWLNNGDNKLMEEKKQVLSDKDRYWIRIYCSRGFRKTKTAKDLKTSVPTLKDFLNRPEVKKHLSNLQDKYDKQVQNLIKANTIQALQNINDRLTGRVNPLKEGELPEKPVFDQHFTTEIKKTEKGQFLTIKERNKEAEKMALTVGGLYNTEPDRDAEGNKQISEYSRLRIAETIRTMKEKKNGVSKPPNKSPTQPAS